MYGEHVDGKMEFNPEEIKNGKLFNFLKVLMDMKCEIRMWTDDYCYIVEYLERFRKEDGEEFVVNEEVLYDEEEEEDMSPEENLFEELTKEELEDYKQKHDKKQPQVINVTHQTMLDTTTQKQDVPNSIQVTKVPQQTNLDQTTQDVLDSIGNNEID